MFKGITVSALPACLVEIIERAQELGSNIHWALYMMKLCFLLVGMVLLATACGSSSPNTGIHVLHSFSGSDGAAPRGSLTLVGSTLYGRTSIGGVENIDVQGR